MKPFIEFEENINYTDITVCKNTWDSDGKLVYTIVASCFQFIAPVVVVIFSYIAILIRLKNRPQVSHQEEKEKQDATCVLRRETLNQYPAESQSSDNKLCFVRMYCNP